MPSAPPRICGGPFRPGRRRPTLLRRPPQGRRASGDRPSPRLEEGHHTCHPDPAHTPWGRPRGAWNSTGTLSTLLAEALGGGPPPPPAASYDAYRVVLSRAPHSGGPRNSHALRSHSLRRRYSLPPLYSVRGLTYTYLGLLYVWVRYVRGLGRWPIRYRPGGRILIRRRRGSMCCGHWWWSCVGGAGDSDDGCDFATAVQIRWTIYGGYGQRHVRISCVFNGYNQDR